VDRAGTDQQLLPDLRLVKLAGDLELHLVLQHNDQIIGRVPEVLPALSRPVRPQVAAETLGGPVGGDLRSVRFR
jgi:hypothetical protein